MQTLRQFVPISMPIPARFFAIDSPVSAQDHACGHTFCVNLPINIADITEITTGQLRVPVLSFSTCSSRNAATFIILIRNHRFSYKRNTSFKTNLHLAFGWHSVSFRELAIFCFFFLTRAHEENFMFLLMTSAFISSWFCPIVRGVFISMSLNWSTVFQCTCFSRVPHEPDKI